MKLICIVCRTEYHTDFGCPKCAAARCGICDGEGVVDSGGVNPWGTGIDVRCGHCDGTGEEPKPPKTL